MRTSSGNPERVPGLPRRWPAAKPRATNALLVFAAALAFGCSSQPGSDFPPPANGLQLASGDYTIPASTEKYYCFTHTVQKDVAAVEVQVHAGTLVHHLGIFQVMKGASEPEGFSECPSLIKTTWLPLFGGGRNTGGMQLPAGAGFEFPAGTQVLMQLHLLNATQAAVTDHTEVNLLYADDPTSLTPAGIFALGNMTFDIPTGATGYPVTGQCSAPMDLDVFALFPHMHLLGKSIEFDYGATQAAATPYFKIDPWSFGDQPMKMTTLQVHAGDYLKATCTYDNTSGHDVAYGESTYDEMCFMILFYTPFDRLNGCVD